jgi:hypothetical protein
MCRCPLPPETADPISGARASADRAPGEGVRRLSACLSRLNRRRCRPGCRCNRKPIGRIGAEAAARRNRRAEAWPPIRSEPRCRRRSLRPRAPLLRCRPTPPTPPEPPFPPRAHRRRRRFAAAASGHSRRERQRKSDHFLFHRLATPSTEVRPLGATMLRLGHHTRPQRAGHSILSTPAIPGAHPRGARKGHRRGEGPRPHLPLSCPASVRPGVRQGYFIRRPGRSDGGTQGAGAARFGGVQRQFLTSLHRFECKPMSPTQHPL